MTKGAVLLAAFLCLMATGAEAKITLDPPVQIPAGLNAANRAKLAPLQAQLMAEYTSTQAEIDGQAARCGAVDADSPLVQTCVAEQKSVLAAVAKYRADAKNFGMAVETDMAGLERIYRPAGNGFIGGVTWINGYNFRGLTPEQRAKAIEMLKSQQELAGAKYSSAVDLKKYEFLLSVAASTSPFVDVMKRAFWEELLDGQFTPELQNAYNSLKGRQFEELACHSNGAMICLAALMNKDIKADRVVLYGPQITPQTLKMWNNLVSESKIRSVQIYLNEGDPIAPIAMLTPGIVSPGSAIGLPAPVGVAATVVVAYAAKALFKTNVLAEIIKAENPNIAVKTFPCAASYFPGPTEMLGCHDAGLYKVNRSNCEKNVSSGQRVAGTAVGGKDAYVEPPTPC